MHNFFRIGGVATDFFNYSKGFTSYVPQV